MIYPSVGQYTEAIKLAEQSPEDYFATMTTLQPVLGADGNPVMSSGNFAVVFKMVDQNDGKFYALKCFTRDQEGRDESYRLIADELQDVSSPYITNIQYLEKELFVDSNTDENEFPVLLMDWVEGETLDKYIKNHISEPLCLEMLACDFAYLVDWLLKQPFAHGDLKPDNILVKDDGSLVLIDYDGMYVPKMRCQKARELGSPDFRHPRRTEDDFDEHIDDFAIVTLLLTIKAIALNPNILEDCNAKDCVLLHTQDFSNLAQSAANQKLQELIYDKIFARIYAMFVVVLAEKVMDVAMLASVVGKMDRDEIAYQYADFLRSVFWDDKKAYRIFENLAAKGHTNAQISLSYYLLNGICCEKNKDVALSLFKFFADLGNAKAQYYLGYCYNTGNGVAQDYKQAVKWYTKSAEQGNKYAQYDLGYCYDRGQGIDKDDKKAVEWYTKAAEQGHRFASEALDAYYPQDNGGNQDHQDTVEQYAKAAEQGDINAQFNLGVCYANGQGIEQDYHKAVEWFTKAANQGHVDAQLNLGDCYLSGQGVERDDVKAVEWLTKAAEQGYSAAQNLLGICYYYGKGVENNYQAAVKWFTMAVEQGDANAQNNLGICYANGDGVAPDYNKAVELFTKAVEQANDNAFRNLDLCTETGGRCYNLGEELYTMSSIKRGIKIKKAILNSKRTDNVINDDELPF
ncbi:MAG: SEL1-like repeat protein [Bacteroidales bacterium]|nr:SEL1-like repeat protein [Bacteroidales bacterium]